MCVNDANIVTINMYVNYTRNAVDEVVLNLVPVFTYT